MDLLTGASPVALMLPGGLPMMTPVPSDTPGGTLDRATDALDVTTGQDLTERAFNIAREKYTEDGKRLSKMHERALF